MKHILWNPPFHVRGKRRREKKGITIDYKGMLIMEKYKNEHNAYGYTALWAQSSHA